MFTVTKRNSSLASSIFTEISPEQLTVGLTATAGLSSCTSTRLVGGHNKQEDVVLSPSLLL